MYMLHYSLCVLIYFTDLLFELLKHNDNWQTSRKHIGLPVDLPYVVNI